MFRSPVYPINLSRLHIDPKLMHGFRYLTFLYSCSLTVLWALEQSGLKGGVRVEEAKELTLHLVGTRDCVQTV